MMVKNFEQKDYSSQIMCQQIIQKIIAIAVACNFYCHVLGYQLDDHDLSLN